MKIQNLIWIICVLILLQAAWLSFRLNSLRKREQEMAAKQMELQLAREAEIQKELLQVKEPEIAPEFLKYESPELPQEATPGVDNAIKKN